MEPLASCNMANKGQQRQAAAVVGRAHRAGRAAWAGAHEGQAAGREARLDGLLLQDSCKIHDGAFHSYPIMQSGSLSGSSTGSSTGTVVCSFNKSPLCAHPTATAGSRPAALVMARATSGSAAKRTARGGSEPAGEDSMRFTSCGAHW